MYLEDGIVTRRKKTTTNVKENNFTMSDLVYTISSRLFSWKTALIVCLVSVGYVYVEFGVRFLSFVAGK